MTSVTATAEIFLTAYHALPDEERKTVLTRLLTEEDADDLLDAAIAEARKGGEMIDFEEYLASRKQ